MAAVVADVERDIVPLWRLARGVARKFLHNEADAEDIAQEVMLYSLRSYRSMGNAKSFVACGARSRVIDLIRKKHGVLDRDNFDADRIPERHGRFGEHASDDVELAERAMAELQQLKPDQRAAVEEFVLEGNRDRGRPTDHPMSNREKMLVFRARQTLRQRLAPSSCRNLESHP